MAAVVLYAEFTAKSGQEERVDELIGGLTDQVRAEPGNLEFIVYRERDEPRRFFVFERYADEEAFQTHIGADYGAVFNAALGDLIEEDGSQLTFLSPTARTRPSPEGRIDRTADRQSFECSQARRGRRTHLMPRPRNAIPANIRALRSCHESATSAMMAALIRGGNGLWTCALTPPLPDSRRPAARRCS